MTNEIEQTQEQSGDNVQISIEQICASIIKTLGSVEVAFEDLIGDYSGKNIAVNQNEETKAIMFTLVDSPAPAEETQTETE